jgi:hypothetical protein
MSISRKILVTAAAVAAALAAGCGGHEEAADTAAAPPTPQSASTEQLDLHAAPATTTAPEPITAAETRWREQVGDYAERLDAEANRSGTITHAVMRRSARVYSACGPTLRRAGDPGRFAPVAPQVERACARLTKAARLLGQAIAASGTGGTVVAGTAEERRFDRALGGAIEASGNAQYDLQRALEKAAAIETELEA